MFRRDLRSHFGLNSFIQRLECSHKSYKSWAGFHLQLMSDLRFLSLDSPTIHQQLNTTPLNPKVAAWTKSQMKPIQHRLFAFSWFYINNTNWQWIYKINFDFHLVDGNGGCVCVSHDASLCELWCAGKLQVEILHSIGSWNEFLKVKKNFFLLTTHHSLICCTRRAKWSAHDYCLLTLITSVRVAESANIENCEFRTKSVLSPCEKFVSCWFKLQISMIAQIAARSSCWIFCKS